MKKRIFAMLLSALMLFSVAACGEPKGDGSLDANVYTLLATEKYMRDADLSGLTPSSDVVMHGIKNETQSFQVAFNATKKISSFDFAVADLVNGENKIDKSKISVYAERYTEVYNPYYQPNTAGISSLAGWYPDALVPLDRYKKKAEDVVNSGENQTLWIDVEIPSDAAAGEYKGTFTLTINGKTEDINVKLNVYDLTMPDEVNSPTEFEVWYGQLPYGEGDNYDSNTCQTYYEYLWTKRLNCATLTPDKNRSIEKFIEAIIPLSENPKCTSYRIPIVGLIEVTSDRLCPRTEGLYTPEETAAYKQRVQNGLYGQLKAILDKNIELLNTGEDYDLFKKALYYYEDEPTVGYRTEAVRIFCQLLNNAKKQVLAEYADFFATHSDLKKSFEGVKEICPSNYVNSSLFVNEKDGAPDYDEHYGLTFWCPEMYQFDNASFRETIRQRIEYGERVWWYLCVSNTPRPSYYVESLPVNIRLQSWMQYNYDVEGILYWDVAHYGGDRDNYDDLQYNNYGSGEGILLYPGERYGMKTPISSWRLEQIRLGQQDYELFVMLQNKLGEEKAREIVSQIGEKLYTGTTVKDACTSEAFDGYRVRLLTALEQFAKGNDAAANEILNSIA